MSKHQSLFITQGLAASQVRKKVVESFVAETSNSQITEVQQKTEELLDTVQGIKPHEGVREYRQLKRQMKQARIIAQSQVSKLQKCTLIDLEYARKCIINEPTPAFEQILQVLENEERQNQAILQELEDLSSRLGRIEDDVG